MMYSASNKKIKTGNKFPKLNAPNGQEEEKHQNNDPTF